jgi:hypothetical protein
LTISKITQSGAVTRVWIDSPTRTWEQWLLLRSDAHHDSVHCNRKFEMRHLEQAKERGAWILDGGDCIDGMQGRFDPRRSYKNLREEYRDDNYYDLIINDAIKAYTPYADNWLLFAHGNHETAVLKNANTDPTDRLASAMRGLGSHAVAGGYGGWVLFHTTVGSAKATLKLKYFHGSGGEAPVTRGVIQTNRQQVYLPDADIVWNGHSHNDLNIPIKRERISTHGVQFFDYCRHLRSPGYCDAYGDGSTGWEIERGGVPKPLGCMWVRMFWDSYQGRVSYQAMDDVI